ncbi:MAG: hypothetical protein EA393_09540 [Bacteroidetes bacterium]|nr:MAG: hypothetical protein EA393_09540 [Bacteroidota bacterium]
MMNFKEFHNKMISFVVFSYEDIYGVFGDIDRRRLYEWAKKKYIIPVIKGVYIFNEFKDTKGLEYLIANKIYEPSYLSLEYVMSSESLIPEAVYTLTSISTKKTAIFDTSFGNFSYRNLKTELYHGYELRKIEIPLYGKSIERTVKTASIEKAFFDFVYLKKGLFTKNEILEMRFDRSVLEALNKKSLNKYTSLSNNRTVETNLTHIFKYYGIH